MTENPELHRTFNYGKTIHKTIIEHQTPNQKVKQTSWKTILKIFEVVSLCKQSENEILKMKTYNKIFSNGFLVKKGFLTVLK